MDIFGLSNKVAVVTGANRGLGKDFATGLAKAGADIAVVDIMIDEETIKEIESLGVRCEGFKFNLQEFNKYDELINNIIDKFKTVDILLNNAGVQKRHASLEFPKEDWDFVMDINCDAVFFMCQKIGKIMLDKGCGKIINIASLLSFQGGFTVPAYTASKSAVMGFTKSLSNEWAKFGVNVNCIAPGYMDTEMNTAIKNDEVRNQQILDRIPVGRWGKPDDLIGAAVYLASSASNYVNGITIPVDGGWLGR